MVSSAFAQTMLPSPTGPSSIGRVGFHWRDDSRSEVLSPRATDKREIGVWFWYPAKSSAENEKAPYVDQLDARAQSLSSDEVSLARSVQTHSVTNAALVSSPTRLPVLIFSPGAGSLPALYTSFIEDLASHGYVVVALDHPYDDVAVPLLDGRVVKEAKKPDNGEELLRYLRERVVVRSQDVRFVLDELSRLQQGEFDSPFKGRLDLAHVGVFGHSAGGLTAAEACMNDQRIRACANLDGVVNAQPAYVDTQGRGPSQPFLFVEKPQAMIVGEKTEEARQRLNVLRRRGSAVLASVRRGRSYRITVEGATHTTFSDEEIISDPNAARPRQLLDFIRTYLRTFFDEALNENDSPLLNTSPPDRAIQIETFLPR
jgi:predicted dienelactone hydrolase